MGKIVAPGISFSPKHFRMAQKNVFSEEEFADIFLCKKSNLSSYAIQKTRYLYRAFCNYITQGIRETYLRFSYS